MTHAMERSAQGRGRNVVPGAGLLRRHVSRLLGRLAVGRLALRLPDGTELVAAGAEAGPEAALVLHRWRPVWRLMLEGDLGFAEAYMAGDWETPDLAALLTLAAANEAAFDTDFGGSLIPRLLARLRHLARPNSRRGSRRNIEAHYDLGNDFYAAWLDRGMSYSSALYEAPGMGLEEAQLAKQRRVMELLEILPGQSVLEIGCGWGGVMDCVAARGAAVTGLTLSPAQAAHVTARIAIGDEGGRMAVELRDYRDSAGRYDRIVSIEMFEAVGQEYWPLFFATLRDRLAAGGIAVLQIITIAEERFAGYASRADFIQTHIFPGGMLPTRRHLAEQAAAVGLAFEECEHFAASYAATLAEWATRFEAGWRGLRAQGFDEAFRRKWRYYLAYCEAGFRTGALDVGFYRLRAG